VIVDNPSPITPTHGFACNARTPRATATTQHSPQENAPHPPDHDTTHDTPSPTGLIAYYRSSPYVRPNETWVLGGRIGAGSRDVTRTSKILMGT